MWEWLRRDPAYIAWHRRATRAMRDGAVSATPSYGDIADWGLHFRGKSGTRCPRSLHHLACRTRSGDDARHRRGQ
ncbi:transcriptional regulator domain-containing protein [Sphingomonas paeninsulae]|uniref:transcriptional regulator domain-containing protein n=1 Tax=Sphingomonas paeninsulae TaxID=2319844 RepID=UPI003D34DD3E